MDGSSEQQKHTPAPTPGVVWMGRYARLVAVATFVLICAGGLVTSTGSGLAVPDWPLSFGKVFPRMRGGVLFEHSHRLIAATVGLLAVIQAVWFWRCEARPAVRRVAYVAVATVVVQGLLGGLTVLFLLPTPISVAHAGLAQVFFCLTVTLAVVTSPRWRGAASTAPASGAGRGLAAWATATVAVVYVQILLGALVRHTGAGLAIPDFPLAYGRLVPPLFTTEIAVHFAHRVGALAVLVVAAVALARALGHAGRSTAGVRRPALALGALLVVQVLLAWATLASHRAVLPTTAHVAVGALILAASLVLTLRAWRSVPVRSAAPVGKLVAEQGAAA